MRNINSLYELICEKKTNERNSFVSILFVLRLRLLAIGLVEHLDRYSSIHDVWLKDYIRMYRQLYEEEGN